MREWGSRKLKSSPDKQHFCGFARLESEAIKYHNIFAGLRLESDTWPRQYIVNPLNLGGGGGGGGGVVEV